MTHIGLRSCDCCGSILDDGRLVIELGDLTLNRQFRSVTYRSVPVHLTQQQFDVLELLVLRVGKLVPRSAFFIAVLDEDLDDKQLDVIVCRLRAKFRAADPAFDRILTSWGRGYSWLRSDQDALAA